jgi:2-polyprenyl-3-methyl-5-hydroxy-6-metoxy-1,4-benzoquinol methylase
MGDYLSYSGSPFKLNKAEMRSNVLHDFVPLRETIARRAVQLAFNENPAILVRCASCGGGGV